MFHHGFESPLKDRHNFADTIRENGWPAEWFRKAESGGDLTMTRSLTIDYGDDVLLALGLTPEEFREEAKLLIAVKLYEMGRLSTGAAAALADLPKPLFLTKLADCGVDTFDLSAEELQRDLSGARRHL